MTQDAPTAFFSYSREDSDFALRLAGDLKAAGASVWLDQLDIIPGQRWDRAVEDALANCPRMLVILSPASVNSTNVMDEVSFALEEKKTVIPVIHQDCTVPFRLRRLQYVDFRQDYARALKELLKTLAPQQNSAQSAKKIPEVGERERGAEEDGQNATEAQGQAGEQAPADQEHKRAAGGARPENEAQKAVDRVRLEEQHKRDAAAEVQLEQEGKQADEQVRPDEGPRKVEEQTRSELESKLAVPIPAPGEMLVTTPSPVSEPRPTTWVPPPNASRISRESVPPIGSAKTLGFTISAIIAVALLSGGLWWHFAYRPHTKAVDQLSQGISLYRDSQFSASANLFQLAVRYDAKLVRGWLYLGASYAQQCFPSWGNNTPQPQLEHMCLRAIEAFEEALRIDPSSKLALAGIGSMYDRLQDFEKAKEQFQRLLKIDPNNYLPYLWIGSLDWEIYYRAADRPKFDPFYSPYPEKTRVELERKYGPLVEEGLKALSRAHEIEPNDDTTLAFLSLTYRNKASLEPDRGARVADHGAADDFLDKMVKARQAKAETPEPIFKDFDFTLPYLPPPPPAPAPPGKFVHIEPQNSPGK